MNFAGALVQWGEATGNTEVRDAGAYVYATQAAAIQRYWFDTEGTTFPDGFDNPVVGMVWGDGGAYSTWFSGEAEMIQGINTLPITGSHLYLGADPAAVREAYAHLESVNGGPPTVWQDILWSQLALGDGEAALSRLTAGAYTPEEGESRAHTFHWVRNLATLGTVDTSVRADHPLAATFSDDGERTYVASNVTSSDVTVTFSDGTVVDVPAGRTVAAGAHSWSGGSGTGGPTDPPTEEPTDPPTEEPTDPPTDPVCTGGELTGVLHPSADGSLLAEAPPEGTVELGPAGGATHDGTPHDPVVLEATGLSGAYDGGATRFSFPVDAGTAVGHAVQARVSYDLTGDGSVDRTETYRYFATDPVVGAEAYTHASGLLSQDGALGDLCSGTVRLELWSALGTQALEVGTGGSSTLTIPFG